MHSEENYIFESENPYLQEESFESLIHLVNSLNEASTAVNLTQSALMVEALLQKILANNNSSKVGEIKAAVDYWAMLGEFQAANEKELAAISAFRQALKLNPRHSSALVGISVSYTNEGEEERANQALIEWIRTQYPNFHFHVSELEDFSLTSALASHYEKVLQSCTQSSSGDDHVDPDLLIGLGILYYSMGAKIVIEEGKEGRALNCFKRALTLRPHDASLLNRIGATLANEHQSEQAIAYYERALIERPNFMRALHNLGVAKMNLGKHEEACFHLFEAVSQGHLSSRNQIHISKTCWDTLKRNFILMDRYDLVDFCDTKNLAQLRSAIYKN